MSQTPNFQALRESYLRDLTELDQRRTAISSKIAMLDEILRDMRNLPPTKKEVDSLIAAPVAMPKGTTDAAFWAVSNFGANGIRSREVKQRMADNGFDTQSPSFNVALFKALMRLSKGRILGEKVDGTWIFKPRTQ